MMKVLIVDDEPIIRKVLKSMIRWEEHGLQWGGEAVDGEEAWEAVQQGGIDLVVTDILMPRMDGLELVKRLKQTGADVAVVVLSCLDDFTYVKEAMKHGAHDYILKPTMEPEQLVHILTEARDGLLLQRKDREQSEQLKRQLMLSKQAQWGQRLQKAWVTGMPDEELEAAWFRDGGEVASYLIHFAPGSQMPLLGWQWPDALAYISLSDQRLLLIYEGPSRSEEIRRFLLHECNIPEACFFITDIAAIRGVEQVKQTLGQHEALRSRYFYSDIDGTMMEPEPFSLPAGSGDTLPLEERQNLLKAIAGRNEEAIHHWARHICHRLYREKPPVDQVYSFLYELLGLAAAFARQQTETAVDTFERKYVSLAAVQSRLRMQELTEWFDEACRELAAMLQSRSEAATRNPFVRKAIEYMRNHYRMPISTSDIAEHVKLSRSYLSDLYGKETGESLIEALTRIRIEEAKRLLAGRERKVYEVAEAVGFIDAKTFAKTFKKMVGCTPTEYEEQNK
ncbi:response regulator [Paenibacillus sp. H1-7]|uniref:response regulator n=1 Tax=Paenibacillus sp. H1-7 TaxID=2282849 RepID=UPI001EF87FFC|nr:response regulator [Paenibacillus sp. H1-7]ULL15772.1 response regulator [Paenibacillus sp. H1-7]